MSINPIIFEHFLRSCTAYELRGPWQAFEPDLDCHACPVWGTATLADLAENFTERALIATGVAHELPDGLVLHAGLAGEAQSLIPLRTAPDDRPYGLLTTSGILPHELLPAAAILQDHRTRELLLARGPVLYVAFSIEDLILLRGLGLPTTLAADLFSFATNRLHELELACRWTTPTIGEEEEPVRDGLEPSQSQEAAPAPAVDGGRSDRPHEPEISTLGEAAVSETGEMSGLSAMGESGEPADGIDYAPEPASQGPVDLMLVAWSPTALSLDPPEQCVSLLAQLLQAERYLGVNVSRIAVWQPTPEELSGMRFCLEAGATAGALGIIHQSADQTLFTLDVAIERISDGDREPLGYIAARRKLDTCLSVSADRQNVVKLQEAYFTFERAVDRELIEPLREQALEYHDAVQRSLGLAAADLAKTFHLEAPYIGRSSDRQAHYRSNRGPQMDLLTSLKIVTQLTTICRELM